MSQVQSKTNVNNELILYFKLKFIIRTVTSAMEFILYNHQVILRTIGGFSQHKCSIVHENKSFLCLSS